MLKILRLPRIKSFQTGKVPQKTVTLTNKNGKDVIKDEFVGYYVKRPNFIEMIMELLR